MKTKEAILNNWQAKLGSLIIAVFIWLLVKAHINGRSAYPRPEEFPPGATLSHSPTLPSQFFHDHG